MKAKFGFLTESRSQMENKDIIDSLLPTICRLLTDNQAPNDWQGGLKIKYNITMATNDKRYFLNTQHLKVGLTLDMISKQFYFQIIRGKLSVINYLLKQHLVNGLNPGLSVVCLVWSSGLV